MVYGHPLGPGLSYKTKVTEGVSGHVADFLLFSKRRATGPSYGKSIHMPHLRALRGCSLVGSTAAESRKSAACPEIIPPPPVRKPPPLPYCGLVKDLQTIYVSCLLPRHAECG